MADSVKPDLRPARPGDAFMIQGAGFCAVQHVVDDKVLFSTEGGRSSGWVSAKLAAAAVDAFSRAQPS